MSASDEGAAVRYAAAAPNLESAIRALHEYAERARRDGTSVTDQWLFAVARDLAPQFCPALGREDFVLVMVAGAQRLAVASVEPSLPPPSPPRHGHHIG